MFAVYEVLLGLAFLLALPWFLVIGFMRGKYLPNFPARLGRYRSSAASHDLWIHAVSVGEVLAAKLVVDRILERRPQTSLVVTTTTITGQALAQRSFPTATVTYFPFDFSFAVRRFLDHHRPAVYSTIETEIWPNVTRHAHARGMKLLLANGRISDRSFPRYRLVRPVLRRILASYRAILVREETDRDRFVEIGADPARVEIVGNVKFDFDFDPRPLEIAQKLQQVIRGRKVFVAGSTRQGEDELIVPLLRDLLGELDCFVIIAPRKPERFEVVAGILAAAGIDFVRRSELETHGTDSTAAVLLLDSIGELASIYQFATAAFVGGSLLPTGGHNPIEPAAAGCPVSFGPHMSNFREIAATFLRDAAAVEVNDAGELRDFVRSMLTDEDRQRSLAQRARSTVEKNRGAADRTAARILELIV